MKRVNVLLTFYGVPREVAQQAARELLAYLGEEYANKRIPETASLLERHGGDIWGWSIDESEAMKARRGPTDDRENPLADPIDDDGWDNDESEA
jgi:hypothetical protein